MNGDLFCGMYRSIQFISLLSKIGIEIEYTKIAPFKMSSFNKNDQSSLRREKKNEMRPL